LAFASDEIPDGFKADRYQAVWERNPFTIVTPVAEVSQPKMFDKYALVSWLNDDGKDVVFVQNTETNEVQKVTKDPNANNFRLVAIHKAADPKNAEVVLSNGSEEGAVRFRLEAAAAAPQQHEGGQAAVPTAGVQNPVPGVPAPPLPGSRQAQMAQNAQQALQVQQAARSGGNQQITAPMQPEPYVTPPRATEVRRKRITPPPISSQPVGVPTPALNMPSQPQTQ
jgi:hypothetical protein